MPRVHRCRALATVLAVSGLLVLLAMPTKAVQGAPVGDTLPDLRMASLDYGGSSIYVQRTSDGRRLLRFSTVIVNVGDGPFEVLGQRGDTTTPTMDTVSQRVYDGTGNARLVPTTATMDFGGDGHNHWHVTDLEQFRLTPIGMTAGTRIGAKRGYCFFDNTAFRLTLPGAPSEPRYEYGDCGTSSSTSVDTGLSIGWGDLYPHSLPDQYIDITGLPNGRYKLTVRADHRGQFQELNERNNATYIAIRIARDDRVTVLWRGPSA